MCCSWPLPIEAVQRAGPARVDEGARMKTRSRRLLVAGIAGATAAGVALAAAPLATADEAARHHGNHRSVIFVNGDGMSAAHREAARLNLKGRFGQLEMNKLPAAGFEATTPDDPSTVITDSAAAATAWATGKKTYNGAISVDPSGKALTYLGAEAKKAGKATGLVTTAQVTDASPAAFFSSTAQRSLQSEIARQYLDVSKPDVILGGGEDWWYPAGNPGKFQDNPAKDPTEQSKGPAGDLVAKAKSKGYQYVSSAEQLAKAKSGKLLGLFSNEEMFEQRPEGEGDLYEPKPTLQAMTEKALSTVSKNKKGFFLFVEEEGVDEFSHENNGEKMLKAMAALDQTVGMLRKYVAKHPDTLLVVTGDHDCGGLTVEDTGTTDESGDGISAEDGPFTVAGSKYQFNLDWTTSGHTGVPTPVTAAGYGASGLVGSYQNTHVHTVLRNVLLGR
jgi:alkaline phosphatase